MKPALVFVYNADGGLFNSLADLAHKIFLHNDRNRLPAKFGFRPVRTTHRRRVQF